MENWKFALASIRSHKMRSLLTMLGIIIGVSSVVSIMALGKGLTNSVTNEVGSAQKELSIYYTQSDEEQDLLTDELQFNREVELKEEWFASATEEFDAVKDYYVINQTTQELAFQSKAAKNVTITGVNKNYFNIKKYKLLAGRQFVPMDYSNNARVILLDTQLAQKLFDSNEAAINQVVSLGKSYYLVVGVYEDPQAGSSVYGAMSDGNAVMANTQLAAEFHIPEIQEAFLYIDDPTQANQIGRAAAEYITQISGVTDGHFTMFDLSSALESLQNVVGMMTAVIGSIAGISLLVGGIGVMNIMLVSVTERTREIGLRKALGATRHHILLQFLIESVVLTIIGGLIGLSLSASLIFGLKPIWEARELYPSISPDVVAISLGFSALIGIIFGLLPANKASKLDPIEALRYE